MNSPHSPAGSVRRIPQVGWALLLGACSVSPGVWSLRAQDAAAANPAAPAVAVALDPYVVSDIRPEAFANASIDLYRSKDDALPYVTFDWRDIQASGASNIEDFIVKRLSQSTSAPLSREESDPLFGDGVGNTTNGNGASQGSAINFRGWGSIQGDPDPGGESVILINGRRAPQRATGRTAGLAQASLNIPITLVERIEVLPTSGSAIYGAGATGGVINIITKKQARGGEISVRYENFEKGDAPRLDTTLGVSYGLGARTSLRVTGNWNRSRPIDEAELQDYWDDQFARIKERQPSLITAAITVPRSSVPNITATSTTQGLFGAGTPNSTSVPPGYTGGQGLTPFQNRRGVFNERLPSGVRTRGAESESSSLGLAFDHQLRPGWELALDYQFYRSESESSGSLNPAGTSGLSGESFTVPAAAPTNPFGRDVRVGAADPELYRLTPLSTSEQDRHSISLTLRGDLPRAWKLILDSTYTTSDTRNSTGYTPEPIGGWNAALLAGRYNPFVDPAAARPAAADFFSVYELRQRESEATVRTWQYVARAHGPVWDLPAGPIRLTVGGEFYRLRRARSSNLDRTVNSQTGAVIRTAADQPDAVQAQLDDRLFTNDLWAGYAEASVPIASRAWSRPLLRTLDLQLSSRADQSRSRDAKIDTTSDPSALHAFGLRYEPVTGILARGSFTNGIKLPKFSQLTPSSGSTTVRDPARGDEQYTVANSLSGGNPDLKRESTESRNFGLVLTPKWLWGIRLSVDYSLIERTDAIQTISGNGVLQRESDPFFAARIRREPSAPGSTVPGRVTFLDRRVFNARFIASEDVDFGIEKTWKKVLGGRLIGSASFTKRLKFEQQIADTSPRYDIIENVDPSAGGFPPAVRWNANGWIRWEGRAWAFGWSSRFYDNLLVRIDGAIGTRNLALTGGERKVDWALTHDAFVEYTFADRRRSDGWRRWFADTGVTLGVNNVLDRDARYYPAGLGAIATAPGDATYGRMIWLRATRRF